jgi:hypothetical protein
MPDFAGRTVQHGTLIIFSRIRLIYSKACTTNIVKVQEELKAPGH